MPFALPAILLTPFARKAAKVVGVALLIGGAVWAFNAWKADLISDAEKAGFADAEKQFTAKIEAANRIIETDNQRLQVMAGAFGALATIREQGVSLQISPITERVTNEVANDPRYRDCRVSDGVLNDIQAARSAGDAAVAAAAAGVAP